MWERLNTLLTKSRKIAIAAIDHRGALKEILHPVDPTMTTDEEIMEWKKLMVELCRDKVSGLLIDPTYGAELLDITAKCGWLLSIEKTGYRGGKEARATDLIENWSVAKMKQAGAAGVKMLLYYDPENIDLAKKQKALAIKVSEECKRERMVFLLEPLSYKVEGSREKEVLTIARDLADVEVDIWKYEYPGSEWACEELSHILSSPWVLLSAGADYETYKQQLTIACRAGAAGMAVGRAVWQEMGQYEARERERYLREHVGTRLDELNIIVEKYGKSVEIN